MLSWPSIGAQYVVFTYVLFLASLSGCAPGSLLLQHIRPLDTYETQSIFQAENAAWPEERWWVTYQDSQLNGLIEAS